MNKLLDWFSAIDPQKRRKSALILLLVSLILGHVNIGAFALGWIPPDVMDAITNYLSWLAITFTAVDVLVTADVRVQQQEDE